jgi:restriction endonuclease S subunit
MSQFIEMFGDTHSSGNNSKRWKEVVDIINGKDYKTVQVEQGGYPVYGTGGEMARASEYLSPENSILLGRKGTIDKPLLIKEKYWNVDTAFAAVPDANYLNYIYFYWHCKTIDFKTLNKGTTLPSTTKVDLLELWIRIPEMGKQKEFASIVNQADKSGFDGRKSQFIEMFGGGNWPQKTLGEVGSFTRGGGFQKSDFVEHGIPCIHYGQIHTKFGPFITSHITEISSDLESKTKFASKGDLVIAITSEDTEGSCKSTAWLGDYPVAVGGHAAIYKHSMNPLYMSFLFKSTLFNYAKIEYVHGTKVFEIKPDDIAKILVPCPPMSLQNHFSAIAEQADKSGFTCISS